MSGIHRTRSPRVRFVLAVTAVATLLGLFVGGTALAAKATSSEPGTSVANAAQVNNSGVNATFTVTDTGSNLVIRGTARGLTKTSSYVSLIYPDDKCSKTEATSGLTLDGAWQNHGDGTQSLTAVYDGQSYKAIRGKVGSVSVREVTGVTAGAQTFTATLTPRACADLVPNR